MSEQPFLATLPPKSNGAGGSRDDWPTSSEHPIRMGNKTTLQSSVNMFVKGGQSDNTGEFLKNKQSVNILTVSSIKQSITF